MPTSVLGNVFNSAYGMLNPFVTKPLFSTTICVIMTLISAPLPSPGSRLKTLLRELSAPHPPHPGYTIKNHSRSGRAGGGIALIYKSTLSLVKVATGEKTSFQFAEYTIFSDLRWLFTVLLSPPLTPSLSPHSLMSSPIISSRSSCRLSP